MQSSDDDGVEDIKDNNEMSKEEMAVYEYYAMKKLGMLD